jgi:hypothetical protein
MGRALWAVVSIGSIGVLALGCNSSGDRYSVSPGNQGRFEIKREDNPMPQPAAAVAPTTGPTEKELALQRKIEQMESQQRKMADEIDRLKAEKAKEAGK